MPALTPASKAGIGFDMIVALSVSPGGATGAVFPVSLAQEAKPMKINKEKNPLNPLAPISGESAKSGPESPEHGKERLPMLVTVGAGMMAGRRKAGKGFLYDRSVIYLCLCKR
jgi:hypothetical protein